MDERDGEILKGELINEKIQIANCVKIDQGIRTHFKFFSCHYYVERADQPNVTFAIPINEDYRSTIGIKFHISIDEIEKLYRVYVHGNFLFAITCNEGMSSSIRRYQSESDECWEKNDLPFSWTRSVIFGSWLFYLTFEGDLISVNMNDLSWSTINTNLKEYSDILGIDEDGTVNVQTHSMETPVHLLSAKLPDKYVQLKRKELRKKEERIEELESERKSEEELERDLEPQCSIDCESQTDRST